MSRTRMLSALVLRTYDVGEADRFCVLLTSEEGKLTARAPGVRRLTSRMGAALIPFTEVKLQVRESSAGRYVTSAQRPDEAEPLPLSAFGQASEGIEFLLRLLQDGEATEGVFPLTMEFIAACRVGIGDAVTRFGLRLLSLLGLLPVQEHFKNPESFSREDLYFLQIVRQSGDERLWSEETVVTPRLRSLFTLLIQEHLLSPLKATGVSQYLQ